MVTLLMSSLVVATSSVVDNGGCGCHGGLMDSNQTQTQSNQPQSKYPSSSISGNGVWPISKERGWKMLNDGGGGVVTRSTVVVLWPK